MGEITTIEQYLSEIGKIQIENNVFYRGHSDKNFELTPSIYRKEHFIKNEHLIYREAISKVPYDFNGKSTIESLVLMQHYGIPTRILDLTTNALVALYFACIDNKDKDGEVIIFDIPKESTCYFDSDRVTILANLAKCDGEFYYTCGDLAILERYKKNLLEVRKEIKSVSYDVELKKEFLEKVQIETLKKDFFLYPHRTDIDKHIENIIPKCMEKYDSKDEKKALKWLAIDKIENKINILIREDIEMTNEIHFGKLLHYIRDDKSYFQPIINPTHLNKVFTVLPKLDNPRIVRQQGAFLIFGTKEKHISSFERNQKVKITSMPKVPLEWIKAKIEIDANSKETILKQLAQLGIDKSTLFPEIEKIAEYIKEKYGGS